MVLPDYKEGLSTDHMVTLLALYAGYDALDAAVEAATEAHVAGLDPNDCLIAGIYAFLYREQQDNS